jgi:glycoprotein 3-alpha-L-fucosyltransferase
MSFDNTVRINCIFPAGFFFFFFRFVSNCNSTKRLQYYEQLKEYFPISAFGKCIVNLTNSSQNCTHRSKCELQKYSTSKFYLAFESTAVRLNYITEKFWRSLSLGLIPIVLGPKRRDYEQVTPPNSFIYAEDYKNPETLAKHLHDIATNQNEYEKYHQWRIDYETHYRGQDLEPFRFCELCYRLNTNRDRIWYTNINQYFLETN